MNARTIIVGGAALALVAAALYIAKKGFADAAAGVVGAVGDVAAGTVLGIGDVLGIPRTNETECEAAQREGRTLDASFACSADSFISWSWGGLLHAEGTPLVVPPTEGAFGPDYSPDPSGSNWGA